MSNPQGCITCNIASWKMKIKSDIFSGDLKLFALTFSAGTTGILHEKLTDSVSQSVSTYWSDPTAPTELWVTQKVCVITMTLLTDSFID